MKNFLHSLLIVLLMLAAFVILVFTAGCSETPWCTDSFCLVPRDTIDGSEVIEVDEAKVFALIGKTDTVLPPTPPVLTLPATDGSLSDITADVAAGNTTYLNQAVTVTGYVAYKDDKGDAMVIHTNADATDATSNGVVFWVESFGNPEALNSYLLGNQYTFTVTIYLIREPEGKANWRSIWSKFPE